ncbi:hypothetical protein [Pseudonocardia zijingensis]|uniref:Uncharacterized protein n=1 Tax=Pseudonocardia zijingensis TaxID=153376 RepID=A0ABN1N8T2_9PSEU
MTDASAIVARPATAPAEATLADIAQAVGLPDDAHTDDVLRAVRALARPEPAIVLRLPFTRPPITANEARSTAHWSNQNIAKRQVAHAVVAIVKHARIPHLDRVAITLTWYAPDHGTRDSDSLYPMAKAVIDALTPPAPAIPKGAPTKAGTPRKRTKAAKLGAGILNDDHAGIVTSTTTAIVLGDPDPRIELALQPLPPAPGRRTVRPRRPSRAQNVSQPARRKTPRVATLDNLQTAASDQTSHPHGATRRRRPTRQDS